MLRCEQLATPALLYLVISTVVNKACEALGSRGSDLPAEDAAAVLQPRGGAEPGKSLFTGVDLQRKYGALSICSWWRVVLRTGSSVANKKRRQLLMKPGELSQRREISPDETFGISLQANLHRAAGSQL